MQKMSQTEEMAKMLAGRARRHVLTPEQVSRAMEEQDFDPAGLDELYAALEMRGVQRTEGLPISVAAILAGNDFLLGPLDPLASYQELLAAYRSGILPAEVINDRCLRILCYKLLLHAGATSESPLYNKEQLYEALHTPEMRALAKQLQNKVSQK